MKIIRTASMFAGSRTYTTQESSKVPKKNTPTPMTNTCHMPKAYHSGGPLPRKETE